MSAAATPHARPGPRVSVGQHSAIGPKDSNDDSFGVLIPEGALLDNKGIAMAIADGMSSSEAAKVASETCVKSFLEDYYATHASWTVKTAVGRVLSATNRWLHGQSQSNYLSDRGMVSTFSGAVLKAGIAYLFHAGDSRIYLLRDGTIEQLTRDHRTRVSRQREYLSRAVGVSFDLELDYREVPLEAGDLLLFSTDGVHEHVRDAQLLALAQAGDDLDGVAARIVAAALTQGSLDNATCQIVRIEDPGRPDAESYLKRLSGLPFPPGLTPGMLFEGYRVTRELHASNRSQVFLAVDAETGTEVVLKTPSVNFEDDPAYLEMFTREEWIGTLIASPHVLRMLPPRRARRYLYHVSEYVAGTTLRDWMAAHPRPAFDTVHDIIEQVARGLRALHRREIIHRDLKPENILIGTDGIARIIDFGSALVAGVAETPLGIRGPAIAGTMNYTAPEYFTAAAPTDKADTFSLGAIAYEMLTGRSPYGAADWAGPARARPAYTPAARWRDDVPHWLDAALEKAVQPEPAARADTLSEFVEETRPRAFADNMARRRAPLLERDPVLFWRVAALVLLVLNLAQLYFRSR